MDPSGGSADAMTLAIAHAEGERGKEIAVVDLLREVRPPFQPSAVVEQFSADMRRYGVRECTGDRYAGQWPAEQFQRCGIT